MAEKRKKTGKKEVSVTLSKSGGIYAASMIGWVIVSDSDLAKVRVRIGELVDYFTGVTGVAMAVVETIDDSMKTDEEKHAETKRQIADLRRKMHRRGQLAQQTEKECKLAKDPVRAAEHKARAEETDEVEKELLKLEE